MKIPKRYRLKRWKYDREHLLDHLEALKEYQSWSTSDTLRRIETPDDIEFFNCLPHLIAMKEHFLLNGLYAKPGTKPKPQPD